MREAQYLYSYFERSASAGVSNDEVCARDVRRYRGLESVHVDREGARRALAVLGLVLPAAHLHHEAREARAREQCIDGGVVECADERIELGRAHRHKRGLALTGTCGCWGSCGRG